MPPPQAPTAPPPALAPGGAAALVLTPKPSSGRPRLRPWGRYAGLAILLLLAVWLCLLVSFDPVRGRYIGARTCKALPNSRPDRLHWRDCEDLWTGILRREQVVRTGMTQDEVWSRLGPPTSPAAAWSGAQAEAWGPQYWKDGYPVEVQYGPDGQVTYVAVFNQ